MAVFLANSGGAWDNAKKLVEDGHHPSFMRGPGRFT
ncbi:sodium/proton-translocating pyrophosphatase [Streptomyces sp. NPDC002033]